MRDRQMENEREREGGGGEREGERKTEKKSIILGKKQTYNKHVKPNQRSNVWKT